MSTNPAPVQIFYEDLSEVKEINKHAAFIAGKSSLPKPALAVHFFSGSLTDNDEKPRFLLDELFSLHSMSSGFRE